MYLHIDAMYLSAIAREARPSIVAEHNSDSVTRESKLLASQIRAPHAALAARATATCRPQTAYNEIFIIAYMHNSKDQIQLQCKIGSDTATCRPQTL